MSLDLHIEELVLHGFRPGDRHAIAEAVQRELALLLSAGGPLTFVDPAVLRIDGGSFDVPRGAPPAVVGGEIARAIHRGLAPVSAGPRPAQGRG